MADLPSANADPLRFAGNLQPHTGREPVISNNPIGPGEYDTHVHTIGPQMLSQRPTLPAYSFGFGGPSLDVHKYPEEHFEAQMYPGPGKYGTGHSSIGHQYSSKRSNPPSCSFGTGIRDPHSPLRKASQTVPGAANTIKPHVDMGAAPGDYGAGPESIGFQTLSHRGTLPSYTFGSTGSRVRQRDRFKQDRVTHYGDDSPGPCQYDGHRVLVAFGKSMLSGKREVGAAKFGTSNKHTLGSFKKPAQNHDPHYPGPGKYMLMSSIGKQTESQRPTPKSTTFGKQMKIDGPGSFFNEGSEDMPGPGKYGMLGHGPGSPRSRGVVFGTTRKFRHHRVIMKDQKNSPRQQRYIEAIKRTQMSA